MAFVAIIALINGIIGGVGAGLLFANVSLESIFSCVAGVGMDYGGGLE